MKIFKISFLVLVLALAFTGCKKGDTGPQGPAGYNGNANVTSIIATVNSSATWQWSGTAYYVNVTVPALTSDILNRGAVEVFINTDGTGSYWLALPYTDVTTSTNHEWIYAASLNNVAVEFAWNNAAQNGDPNYYYASSILIKVVCIAASGMIKNQNVNLHNYEEIKTAFHLND